MILYILLIMYYFHVYICIFFASKLLVMPKIKHTMLLRGYCKDDSLMFELPLFGKSYSDIYSEFSDYASLLISGEFTYLYRLDLLSAGRVITSVQSFRHIVNQKNLIINFNKY